jgi:hypothetical protein
MKGWDLGWKDARRGGPTMAGTNWEEAARRSPREAAYTTQKIEHEGKMLLVDIVKPLKGPTRVQWHDILMDIPRPPRVAASLIDRIRDWHPY